MKIKPEKNGVGTATKKAKPDAVKKQPKAVKNEATDENIKPVQVQKDKYEKLINKKRKSANEDETIVDSEPVPGRKEINDT